VSYYQLLNVRPDAGTTELRQAFRTLSKRYHPDTTELPPREAAVRFQQLQRAYATLVDPDQRRAYDAALREAAMARVPPPVVLRSRPTRRDATRRALSGGEWFALLLLGLALLFSLVIGIGLAWARGVEMMTFPSWWPQPEAAVSSPIPPSPDAQQPPPREHPPVSPPPSGPGELAERPRGKA
jgi:curved DNA-binding protein CbpA